jgi:glycosyltransferase involved in cell wall biosynthesis
MNKNTALKISVIITAYNEEKYIGRCLRSILNQSITADSYEVIVVDDGSNDSTIREICKYSEEILLIKNDKNLGLPYSINRGIEASKGQFIVRLDADDYVHNDYLRVLSLALHQNNNIDASACDYIVIDDRQNKIEIYDCEKHPIGCGIMYRREQIIEIGLYDEQFRSREEEEFSTRFCKLFAITRIPIPLYYYHKHGNNMTENKIQMDYYKKLLRIKNT